MITLNGKRTGSIRIEMLQKIHLTAKIMRHILNVNSVSTQLRADKIGRVTSKHKNTKIFLYIKYNAMLNTLVVTAGIDFTN